MTTIFSRVVDAPKTRAMVLGIGRFPYLPPAQSIQACVDSAQAMVELLVRNKDTLLQPLATVDCLISMPGVEPGADEFTCPEPAFDPRGGDLGVASATANNVVEAFMEWTTNVCEPGDNLIVYACAHGLVESTIRNLLVLEDFGKFPKNPGNYLLDINALARDLVPATQAASAWIFIDACSTFSTDLASLVGGVQARQVVASSLGGFFQTPANALTIIGSSPGQPAGTGQTGIAYFSQALLSGVETALVERVGPSWMVTSSQLSTKLEAYSRIALQREIAPTTLTNFNKPASLMPVANPQIPILVRSTPEALLRYADSANICLRNPPGTQLRVKVGSEAVWRDTLSLDQRELVFTLISDGEPQSYDFTLDPPCYELMVPQ